MTTIEPAAARIDRERVAALAERQRAIHRERTAGSGRMFERAAAVMPGGVPSSFQRNDPWPVYLRRGEGARVWDVDGNEYVEYGMGLRSVALGHAYPTVVDAVRARLRDGTNFTRPALLELKAADALAAIVRDDQLNANYIIPSVFDHEVTTAVAAAVADQARQEPGATAKVSGIESSRG